MSKTKIKDLSDQELASKLKAFKSIQITVMAIFAVIILAWILLGYWRTNVPVFISTIALGVGTSGALVANYQSLKSELARRNKQDNPSDLG